MKAQDIDNMHNNKMEVTKKYKKLRYIKNVLSIMEDLK